MLDSFLVDRTEEPEGRCRKRSEFDPRFEFSPPPVNRTCSFHFPEFQGEASAYLPLPNPRLACDGGHLRHFRRRGRPKSTSLFASWFHRCTFERTIGQSQLATRSPRQPRWANVQSETQSKQRHVDRETGGSRRAVAASGIDHRSADPFIAGQWCPGWTDPHGIARHTDSWASKL